MPVNDLRVVIVGGKHVGYHTARRLDNRGHDVVIIEKDEDRADFLSDQYIASVIHGDGGRPSILRQADLARSDVLASLTSYGAMTNLGICMTGQRIAPDIRTVARIDHGDDEEYEEMVDAVVYPEELAAYAAANEVIKISDGGVRTIEEITDDLELMEITVSENAPVAGKTLEAVSLPRGAVVVADNESDQFPGPDTVFEPGRAYILAVRTGVTDEVVRLLRG
ncbi:potassium channel family protein [Halobellus clavatus]|jgi:trk system potassium uptake protein TrkA|uniref:Trk system potassium uptake protein TrkA n=1 Tax=Halobellus clavatus TaxID=660517 RepID=A0A1H3EE42_9EURY|nr:TrkA family potassium uptake protein [Halobellus clavatus]SDX76179.1 trk system potassium uptake protein TrkA [Halobellus clavatus]